MIDYLQEQKTQLQESMAVKELKKEISSLNSQVNFLNNEVLELKSKLNSHSVEPRSQPVQQEIVQPEQKIEPIEDKPAAPKVEETNKEAVDDFAPGGSGVSIENIFYCGMR